MENTSSEINKQIEQGFNKTVNDLKNKTNEIANSSENYLKIK